jgi:hypothetical protein
MTKWNAYSLLQTKNCHRDHDRKSLSERKGKNHGTTAQSARLEFGRPCRGRLIEVIGLFITVVISNNEISWKKRCDFAKTFCLSASQER